VSPDTLQTLGVLAIGLGFVLIGLGGFSTYHASTKLQHEAEMREVTQKGELNTQIMTLLMKNQELQQKVEAPPPIGSPPEPTPPATYYRPPSPPPPSFSQVGPTTPEPSQPETTSPAPPAPAPTTPEVTLDPMERSTPPNDWHEPESLEPDMPARYLSAHQRHVIADTLRAHGRYTVTVESSYGDKVSREFAEELAAAFAEADWMVRGIDEHRGLPLASGVTVSAGSFPPKQETRAMYEALLSAGIPVTQQLNPKQHDSETVVLVGAPL